MIVISLGVGGIGLAGGFEQLYLCRLLTGLGVAGLSTAATMTVTGERGFCMKKIPARLLLHPGAAAIV